MASLIRPADITQSELDNALVHQKDMILYHINEMRLDKAQSMLSIVREMWTICGYSYKIVEIENRLRAAESQWDDSK